MWMTNTDSPLGSLIDIWAIEVTLVSNVMEWTMWSIAPLSIIQSLDVMLDGMIRLDENTEWSKITEEWRQKVIELEFDDSRVEIDSLPMELKKSGKTDGLEDCEVNGLEDWTRTVVTWWVPRLSEPVWATGYEPKVWEWSVAISWWHWEEVRATVVSSSSLLAIGLATKLVAWFFPCDW